MPERAEFVSSSEGGVDIVTFSPDGRTAATASYEEDEARVWDAATGQKIAELTQPGIEHGSLTGLSFSPDGNLVVAGSVFGTAWVWETHTGKLVVTLYGHNPRASAHSAAFSPDGKFIITASGSSPFNTDKTARVWELSTGRALSVLRGHRAALTSSAFSRDGKTVITTSDDNTARLYSCEVCAPIEGLLTLARTRVTRSLTLAKRETYLHE